MSSLCLKFHDDRCKGKVVMQIEPFYLTARLQTDGVIQVYPPNFVAGGINTLKLFIVAIIWQKQV